MTGPCPVCGQSPCTAECVVAEAIRAELEADWCAGGTLAPPDDGRDDGITDLYAEEGDR